MQEKFYSIGELAKLSGTTIRTIQYYDKIGLLVANREKNNKLRFYSQNDLITLQQILFYKKLGVPLKEIKSLLMNSNLENKYDIKKILKKQSNILFQKEMDIKMNIAIIEAIIATIDTESNEDLEAMMKLALSLNNKTILDYTTAHFDEKTSQVFEDKYPDYNEVVEIYWNWKQLILEAAYHKINQIPYTSEAGYQFGKKWHEFIEKSTGNEPEMLDAYNKGLEQSDQWPEEDYFLYHFCNDFIDHAYSWYKEKKGDES